MDAAVSALLPWFVRLGLLSGAGLQGSPWLDFAPTIAGRRRQVTNYLCETLAYFPSLLLNSGFPRCTLVTEVGEKRAISQRRTWQIRRDQIDYKHSSLRWAALQKEVRKEDTSNLAGEVALKKCLQRVPARGLTVTLSHAPRCLPQLTPETVLTTCSMFTSAFPPTPDASLSTHHATWSVVAALRWHPRLPRASSCDPALIVSYVPWRRVKPPG